MERSDRHSHHFDKKTEIRAEGFKRLLDDVHAADSRGEWQKIEQAIPAIAQYPEATTWATRALENLEDPLDITLALSLLEHNPAKISSATAEQMKVLMRSSINKGIKFYATCALAAYPDLEPDVASEIFQYFKRVVSSSDFSKETSERAIIYLHALPKRFEFLQAKK